MKAKNTKGLSIEALIEPLNALRKEEDAKEQIARRFQSVFLEEGLFSHTIKDFVYPMAVFGQDGTIFYVSAALTDETGMAVTEQTQKKHNILNYITDSNFHILDAIEDVFSGKTNFLVDLFDPLALFISDSSRWMADDVKYQSAIFFPIAIDCGRVTHGAVIFIKEEK